MTIDKVLNNNVVISHDENGAEVVLMGRGLAFGRRAGDPVAAEKVEKPPLPDSFTQRTHRRNTIAPAIG